MTLRGTIHGSGCHLRICCLKKKYKIICRISQVKRTKAASQYAVVSDFETGFFQAIHLPESPGTTMSDPVQRRLSSVQARTPGWPHNFFQKRLHRHLAARQREQWLCSAERSRSIIYIWGSPYHAIISQPCHVQDEQFSEGEMKITLEERRSTPTHRAWGVIAGGVERISQSDRDKGRQIQWQIPRVYFYVEDALHIRLIKGAA